MWGVDDNGDSNKSDDEKVEVQDDYEEQRDLNNREGAGICVKWEETER